MSLGLVIPVWNDQATLNRLLWQVRDMTLFEQIVVVDDGSDVPVELLDMGGLPVVLLRNDTPQGPGHARNRGLGAVRTRHVLFFDSDDMLTPAFVDLWRDLQDARFDFCLFRHCDSRQALRGHWGMMGHDAALWRAAGMGGRALAAVTGAPAAALAQTTNFPWNKIWRTDTLHTHAIRCSDIRVHEDIEPHWMGFLHCQDILASDRVAATHHVVPGAARLTNLRGPERLEVFGPTRRILGHLQSAPPDKAALLPAFLNFCVEVFDWIEGNLELCWHTEFATLRRAFWHQAVPADLFDRLSVQDPHLSLRLCLQMIRDRPRTQC